MLACFGSRLSPATPVPATVVMMPSRATWRTRWPSNSEIYRLPTESKTTLRGDINWAATAGAAVARGSLLSRPGDGDDGAIGRDAADLVIAEIGDHHVARRIHRQAVGRVQLRQAGRTPVAEEPGWPFPARVEMMPAGSDLADAVVVGIGNV